MPISSQYQKVDAVAVVSKVVNVSAKKVAKEAIQDTAVQMSMNFVMDYKYTPKDNKTPKEGYSFICMPKDKTSTGDCSKTMQVKTQLSSSDKTELGNRVGNNLDKKIAGGIGATRWGKFLNWFVPIFSIGMGVAVIDYAMDGEVSDLFDELAYDSLVELGLITSEVSPNDIDQNIAVPKHLLYSDGIVVRSKDLYYVTYTLKDSTIGNMYSINNGERNTVISFRHNVNVYGDAYISTTVGVGSYSYIGEIRQHNYDAYELMKKFEWNGTSYGGDQARQFIEQEGRNPGAKIYYHDKVTETDLDFEVPALPKFDQLNVPRTNPANVPKKIVAPGGLPYTEKTTGEELLPYPKTDGTTGFKTKIGTEVPEDNVEVGNPKIIENTDGSKTVVKTPTANIPSPSPSDNGSIPPPKTPPLVDPEFPDGPSCDAELKLPRLLPLLNQLSETFPFSIPWDLKSGFDAIFVNMGSEKPKFEYKLAFQGKEHDFSFNIPSFFDSWMPFIHSILLLTFDIGIVYAIYRFMKGGSG